MILFEYIHDKWIEEKNHVAYGFSILSGWVVSLYALPDNSVVMVLGWVTILKTLFGVGVSMLTLFAGMIVTDVYKYCKPKVIKYFKKLFNKKTLK